MTPEIPQEILDMYTDILAHRYDRSGKRVACGTTMGKVIILEREEENNDVKVKLNTTLPNKEPILGLDWGQRGIVVGVKKGLYVYVANESSGAIASNPYHVDCMFDVMDVRMNDQMGQIVTVCDDGKLRVFDVQTQKLVLSLHESSLCRDVLSINEKHLASGGQDGVVFVYDANFRSKEPTWKLDLGRKLVPGLAMTNDSTWLAAGFNGSPAIYNMRTQVALPPLSTDLNQKIFTMTFTSEGVLWWGGEGTTIYNTECLSTVSSSLRTEYGGEAIHHIFSIAAGKGPLMSVTGASTGMLFTDSGKYWDTFVTL